MKTTKDEQFDLMRLIDDMKKGKYKGVDVLLVTDPFFGMHDRAPLGVVIMAGKRV